MKQHRPARTRVQIMKVSAILVVIIFVPAAGILGWYSRYAGRPGGGRMSTAPGPRSPVGVNDSTPAGGRRLAFRPYEPKDTSGFQIILATLERWEPGASLEKISESWREPGHKIIAKFEPTLEAARRAGDHRKTAAMLMTKSLLFNYEGEPNRSYEVLCEARSLVESDDRVAQEFLFSIIYFQGAAALRRGETENCIMCRGESSCILPIASAAVHTNPAGSRLAIHHFTEYLEQFPNDLGVRWLLNLAHMTLGEHPGKVDPRFVISLDRFRNSEFDIGKFRDVGQQAGVNRFNQSGGSIMEDFDNDGWLDLVVSSYDPLERLGVYWNKGNGAFEERGESAGVTNQLGGLNCVQTDYNNDGLMDVYIPRGAWLPLPVRPSLLRNNGDRTFTDVTQEAGLLDPVNSGSAGWADYDNDGWLDVFICCERQPNRLYHNQGNGKFEELSARAGLRDPAQQLSFCKGSAWVDFDNDNYPDLFVNNLRGVAELYRNNHDGTFSNVTGEMNIKGPYHGFSCWAFDYDNDGWLDLFATCFDRTLEDVVKGLLGQPHSQSSNRLYRNMQGKGFEDKTKEAGLDQVFSCMGSNHGDFDNDGFLDFYLGTGDPNFDTLVPNRMFKNVAGARFAEITGTSGTGHLQKGHGVACGDWDRDGDVDLFVQTGGAVTGDRYHNLLFQNPGQGNHWLTVKLIGTKTNRAAIGARIKVVTAGEKPLTIRRHVSSGSSFGANALQQHIGLASANRIAVLEVYWPTSGTTQVFRDIGADQAIEVTEFAESYRPLIWKPITPSK
jgi:ASPIC and UnbV/FG-GAP-like repeat